MRRLILFLVLVSGLLAEFDKVATTTAPFLKLPAGSRATAMAGAMVARADDGFAIYWNPAGMLAAVGPTIAFSSNDWVLDIRHQYAALTLPTDRHGRLGFALTTLTMGEQEITTVDEPDGTGLYYDVGDMALALAYARQVSDRFGLGGSVKVVQLTAYNESARTLALDLGTQLKTDFHGLVIGMSLSNFGGEPRFRGRDLITREPGDEDVAGTYDTDASLATEAWPLPLLIRIGVAVDLLGRDEAFIPNDFTRLSLSLDGVHPNDGPEHLNLGGELAFQERFYLRAGYRYNYDTEGLTLGGGLRLDLRGLGSTTLDYALKTLGPFGTTTVLSLTLQR